MVETVMTPGQYLIRQVASLSKAEYEIVRNSILKNLLAYGSISSAELEALVIEHLHHKLHDSLWQYYVVVLQDLEARGELQVDRDADIGWISMAE